jgi:hypothetical protein
MFWDEEIAWVTRDEDFWLDAPPKWCVIWVNCHNPRLSFINGPIALAIGRALPEARPGSRLMISEEVVGFF